MKRIIGITIFLSLFSLSVLPGLSAATVNGHAYKDGQTDHSGITIDLEPLPPIPTIGVTGLMLLVLGFSFFLLRKRGRAVMILMVVCIVAGLSCFTYAAMRATTVTNSLGEYDFADVEPGGYSIDASAPGYYPEHIASFTIIDGANLAPDMTLYPMTPTDNIVGNMRYVPGGTFTQGSPSTEPCRGSSEPQFTHTLTRNLAVMETEITRQMWADLRVVQPTLPVDPSNTTLSPTMSHPVQRNTWYEAVLFANLLSMQNGSTSCYYRDSGFTDVVDSGDYINDDHYCDFDADGYRLATEGEWEYFCRAGTTTAFSCNENYTSGNCGSCTAGTHPTLEQYCVYCANDPGTTAVTGSKLANPWGLKDVHGNVWEWCWDWYGTYPTGSSTDYEGFTTGSYRVLRSGSWYAHAQGCRSALRSGNTPDNRGSSLGFRLLRTTY